MILVESKLETDATAGCSDAGLLRPDAKRISQIALEVIIPNPDLQPRITLNRYVVDEYSERMKAGQRFPAITIFRIEGKYYLADGFHRYNAAINAGLQSIGAEIFDGDMRSAILFSVGANADHGLRRTNKDKRRAVLKLLQDPEWGRWTDREIARRCGVTHPYVAQIRASLVTVTSERQDTGELSGNRTNRIYRTRHRTTSTMDISRIGRHQNTNQTITSEPQKQDSGQTKQKEGLLSTAQLTDRTFVVVESSSPSLADLLSQIHELLNSLQTKGKIDSIISGLSDEQRLACASQVSLILEQLNKWDQLLAIGANLITEPHVGHDCDLCAKNRESPEKSERGCEVKSGLTSSHAPAPSTDQGSGIPLQQGCSSPSAISLDSKSDLPEWKQTMRRNLKDIMKRREAEKRNRVPLEPEAEEVGNKNLSHTDLSQAHSDQHDQSCLDTA